MRWHWKVWALLYLLTLLLAVAVAYPLHTYLESKVGHSLMAGKMVEGFHYTFYSDFMNHYGDGIAPILNQSVLALGLYALLWVFLTGGILALFIQQGNQSDRAFFLGESARFFWRILALTLIFAILHVLVLVFFIAIYLSVTKGLSPNNLESEAIIFAAFKYMAPVYLLSAAFVSMWQDYSKIILVEQDDKWALPSVFRAIRFIFKHFKKTSLLYLLNLLLLCLLFGLNYLITSAFEIRTFSTILLSFLLSQIFVISRLGLKLLNLGSATALRTGLVSQDEVA